MARTGVGTLSPSIEVSTMRACALMTSLLFLGVATMAVAQERCVVVTLKDFDTLSGQHYRQPVCLYAGRNAVVKANVFERGLCIYQGEDVTLIDNRIVVAQVGNERFYPPMRPGTSVQFDPSNRLI